MNIYILLSQMNIYVNTLTTATFHRIFFVKPKVHRLIINISVANLTGNRAWLHG